MGTATQTQHQTPQMPPGSSATRWRPVTRVAFRFSVIYFGLFCLFTQIAGSLLPIPSLDIPDLSALPPMRQIVFWTAAHVFHVTQALVYTGSGSGDKTFDWVLTFCMLSIAILGTLVWSALDRKRAGYPALYKWFRLFIRFALVSQMLVYGMVKAVPLQMPFPFLTQLVEPYGNFSPMSVLWSSIGASPAYETFTGCAELMGGVLLLFPRTTTLGALICLADMTQVFMLNMTYDVPVKLLSFHLILISVFLLAPEFRRLANFFLLNRVVEVSNGAPLFSSRRANRIALAAQVSFGVLLIAANAYGSRKAWFEYGGGRPRSPLYGIWDVTQMSVDGQVRAPLLNDAGRWRRVIFDFPAGTVFQRMDNSGVYYNSTIDAGAKSLALTQGKVKSKLTFQRPAPDQLILDGTMDNHKVHMQLQLFDRNRFRLVNRGFHWIQEYPFN